MLQPQRAVALNACESACILLSGSDMFQDLTQLQDSADAEKLVVDVSWNELRSAPRFVLVGLGAISEEIGAQRLRVSGGTPSSITIAELARGVAIQPLRAGNVRVAIYRRASFDLRTIADAQLIALAPAQPRSVATVRSVWRGNSSARPLPQIVQSSGSCNIAAQSQTQCGNVTATLSRSIPSVGNGTWQTSPGTNASSDMTITFSSPVSSVTITIHDPTYSGNQMTATDSAGNIVNFYRFQYNNTPGTYSADQATLSGRIAAISLIAAPLDYVAYSGSFTVDQTIFTVTCSPAQVQRGADVTCSAELIPAAAFTVTSARATVANANGFGGPTDVFAPANTFSVPVVGGVAKFNWTGTAAESSAVRILARTNGSNPLTLDDSARFDVLSRTWPALAPAPPTVKRELYGNTMVPFPKFGTRTGTLALGGADQDTLLRNSPKRRVALGPNAGATFYAQSLQDVPFRIWIHPGFTNLAPGQAWYAAQNGSGTTMALIPPNNQVQKCDAAGFDAARIRVERHEGVTQDPQRSHWGLWQQYLVSTAVNQELEKLVVVSPDTTLFLNNAYDVFDKQLVAASTPHQQAQKRFDSYAIAAPQGDYYLLWSEQLNITGCHPFLRP